MYGIVTHTFNIQRPGTVLSWNSIEQSFGMMKGYNVIDGTMNEHHR